MSNQTDFKNKEVFEVIKSAVNKMVDTIRPTFGPASNKVIIDKFAYRMVVDDGVQIARDFELADPFENAVVKIIKEVLIKTNDRAGDGTTGGGLMLQSIINEVAKKSKINGRLIELELKKGLEEVKEYLIKNAREVKSREDLLKVARISFDNEKIAELIADFYHKLGKDGIITIEKSSTMETTGELSEGLKIPRGYISPYMVNNPERMESVIENPYILITDYRLIEASDILPVFEMLVKNGKSKLVIIAENIEERALSAILVNLSHIYNPQTKSVGRISCVAINTPQGENSKTFLDDMALLTGATVLSHSKGNKIENTKLEDLGRCDKFISRKDESIIVRPKGSKSDILMAESSLRSAISNEKRENERKELERRLATFSNKIAVIKVGAATDNEQKTLRYKVEDAVNAVKSSYKNGVVCGAGVSLASIKTSSPILNEALKYPARQLLENMGLPENLSHDENNVMNVVTGKTGNYFTVGVVDPVDVLIAGVESAVSIASILITSSGMIVEYQKENKDN